MDILFLDANVLFSAAYRENAGIARLWDLDDVELITSPYAAEEARRNLLAKKDRPILAAAISARATHLITGDVTHFEAFFEREIADVRILPPARYLREREEATERPASEVESDAPVPHRDDRRSEQGG